MENTEQKINTIVENNKIEHSKSSPKILLMLAIIVLFASGIYLFYMYYFPIYIEHKHEKIIEGLSQNGVYVTEDQKREVINRLNTSPVLKDKDWAEVLKKLK